MEELLLGSRRDGLRVTAPHRSDRPGPLLFISAAEPEAGKAFGALPGAAKGLLGGSVLMLLVSMGVGFVASSRSYVCEF